MLARLFPTAELRRRTDVATELLSEARTLRVTNAAGTDVTVPKGWQTWVEPQRPPRPPVPATRAEVGSRFPPLTDLTGVIRIHDAKVDVTGCKAKVAGGTITATGSADFGPEPTRPLV